MVHATQDRSGKIDIGTVLKTWDYPAACHPLAVSFTRNATLRALCTGTTSLVSDPMAILSGMGARMVLSFELKISARLGVGCKVPNEIRIINRIVRVDDKGLYYETDPRHVDLLDASLGITIAN